MSWEPTPDEFAAWQDWLRYGVLTNRDLREIRYQLMVDDIMQGIAQIIHGVITSRPRLADRYVTIRREVQTLATKQPQGIASTSVSK